MSVDQVPEWFDIPIFVAISSQLLFISLCMAVYRLMSNLFRPVGLNWFLVVQFCLISVYAPLEFSNMQHILISRKELKNDVEDNKPSDFGGPILVVFNIIQITQWMFYILQAFEWAVYINFVSFQGSYLIEELFFRKKEFNKSEVRLCYVFLGILMLVSSVQIFIFYKDYLSRQEFSKSISLIESLYISMISSFIIMILAGEIILER